MSKIIEIIVNPKGETKLETKGFSGGSCQNASAAFEAALGAKNGEAFTPEYYMESETEQNFTQN